MLGLCRSKLFASALAPVVTNAQVALGLVVAGVSSTASVRLQRAKQRHRGREAHGD